MKRFIYTIAWIVLGLMLSFILHFALETIYIKYSLFKGISLQNQSVFGSGYCVLPVWLSAGLFIFGLFGGLFLGRYYWRVIYLENRYKKIK